MEFRILGPLEVRDGDRAIPLGGAKQRALLAVLLLRAGEVVSTDRLVDELWGEDPPVRAGHAVQVYVSNLRKVLEPRGPWKHLLTRPPGYLLELEADELDLHRFERFLGEGRAGLQGGQPERAGAVLREALALWRGPALADFAYEPFAQTAIARLEELRLAALEERIEADLACGRHAELVGELETLVTEHPLREHLRGQLMLALYRSGRQAEALEVYQDARRALVEELGIDPSPALQALERAILRQDPELGVPVSAERRGEAEPELARRSILVTPRSEEAVGLLLELAELLARSEAPHDLILARLIPPGAEGELARATILLNEKRAELAKREVTTRATAFTSTEVGADIVRLASEQAVDLLLHDLAELEGGAFRGDLGVVLADAPCDVALVIGRKQASVDEAPVLVPFGGAEHDWAALELGAWLASARGATLRLAGAAATSEGKRDASRLLAHAALAVQQLVGVPTEPLLVAPGAAGVVEASEEAGLLVMGLPESWRQEGPGETRAAAARAARPATLLVRRGLRPGGLAPHQGLTRYTWSLASTGDDG